MQEVLGSSSPADYLPSSQLHAADAAAHAAEGWRGDSQRDAAHAAERAAAHEAGAADSIERAAEAAAGLMMEVVCPAELAPDRTLRIALPDAREFDVVVPDDVAVGDAFLVGPFPGPSVV